MYPSIRAFQKALERQIRSGDGFTLNGSSSLQSLAQFYGLKITGAGSRSTLADYLARACSGEPRVGDRALCDRRIELVVHEVENGAISKVYLRIMPGWIGERRSTGGVVRGRRGATKDRRTQILRGWLGALRGLGMSDGAQSHRQSTDERRLGERRDIR